MIKEEITVTRSVEDIGLKRQDYRVVLAHFYLDKIEEELNKIAKVVGHKNIEEFFKND